MEKRAKVIKAEVRDVDGKPTLFGRAIEYNQWSELIYGTFQERIMPGAFDKFLAGNPDVIACIDHDPARLLGRTSSATLSLVPDEQGIAVAVPMPETSYARDLAESIRRGDIRGMSFVFRCVTDQWHTVDSVRSRDVVEAELYEVSFVTFPAYPQTSAGVRSIEGSDEKEALQRMELAFARSLDRYEKLVKVAESH